MLARRPRCPLRAVLIVSAAAVLAGFYEGRTRPRGSPGTPVGRGAAPDVMSPTRSRHDSHRDEPRPFITRPYTSSAAWLRRGLRGKRHGVERDRVCGGVPGDRRVARVVRGSCPDDVSPARGGTVSGVALRGVWLPSPLPSCAPQDAPHGVRTALSRSRIVGGYLLPRRATSPASRAAWHPWASVGEHGRGRTSVWIALALL